MRVHHQESFPPPQRIASVSSVWQCTDHQRTGNSLCWDEQADHLYIYVEQQRGKDAALWKAILLSTPSAAIHQMKMVINLCTEMIEQ